MICPNCNKPVPAEILSLVSPFYCPCGAAVEFDDRRARGSNGPCAHLGQFTRAELCPSCRGQVRVKIFACAVHEECTLQKPLDVACCATCEDYVSSPAG